jgi:hypothetical protein
MVDRSEGWREVVRVSVRAAMNCRTTSGGLVVVRRFIAWKTMTKESMPVLDGWSPWVITPRRNHSGGGV